MPTSGAPTVIAAFYNDIMICRNGSLPSLSVQQAYKLPIRTLPSTLTNLRGKWVQFYGGKHITQWQATSRSITAEPIQESRVFLEMYKETMQWVGYSMETGAQVWGPTESQAPMDYYGERFYPIFGGQVAYGNL